VVGKGAFGQAVLYCRKSDGLMSIIKEVNMLDLVRMVRTFDRELECECEAFRPSSLTRTLHKKCNFLCGVDANIDEKICLTFSGQTK